MSPFIAFLLSAVVVAGAGSRLARDGDTIAERTGLGGVWVGAILVAAATSLPELATDVFAVVQGNPNLALGDLLGSSMANMAILATADMAVRHTRVLTRITVNQALVGALAILLTALTALGVIVGGPLTIGGIGWVALAIGGGYVAGMRVLHLNRPAPPFRTEGQVRAARAARARSAAVYARFGIAAVVILIAAHYLAEAAAAVAVALGISQGVAGIVLLAFTTSLPEAVVVTVAIRAGSYDLAIGNLLGSNCFNMAIVPVLDVVHGSSSLLADAEPGLAVTALFAILMMALALLEILNKSERRLWVVEPGPLIIVLAYGAGIYLTFRAGP